MMKFVRGSIPLKICLSILVVEVVFFTGFGIFYMNRFNQEIDKAILGKLLIPSILMSERALNYTAATDLKVMSELVQENVVDCFIAKNDGTIYYTADSTKEGTNIHNALTEQENYLKVTSSDKLKLSQIKSDGSIFLSVLSPLITEGRLLGTLYIRIDAEGMVARKKEVLHFFIIGALLAIGCTTVFEAFWVYRLIVPRINRTSSVLSDADKYDLRKRIKNYGAKDQLGVLMFKVDQMISKLQHQVRKFKSLHTVSEQFLLADSSNKVIDITIDQIESLFPVSLSHTEREINYKQNELPSINERSIILNIPQDSSQNKNYLYFGANDNALVEVTEENTSFIQTLAKMINTACTMIESVQKIKLAEEKFRKLSHSSLEGIFRSTVKGKFEYVNPALSSILGYVSPAQMIIAVDDISTQCYQYSEDREKILKILKDKGTVQDKEFFLRRKDKSIISASISCYGVYDKNKKLIALEGRVADITGKKIREKAEIERQKLEAAALVKTEMISNLEEKNKELERTLQELKYTQKQLVQSEKMAAIGMTVGGVAHDLNNILAGVISYPELLLLKLPDDSSIRRPIEEILASGKRAVAIVADLLTLSQGTAKSRENISLNTLIEEYLSSIEYQNLQERFPNVEILLNLSSKPCVIYCSPIHITKLLMNLLTNAFESTTSYGQVSIVTKNGKNVKEVEDKTSPIGNSTFGVLEVIDNGKGISELDRERIFEPFYSRKEMGKSGTGLGLTIVQNVVQEHEGKIEVTSSENGTVFTVYLPLGDSSADILTDEATGPTISMGKGKILVVDDEPLQRDIAQKILGSFGYEVDTVSSGEDAIIYLTQNTVDLVLLDMLMPPGIDGLETYKAIIITNPTQKTILVSGFADKVDVEKAIDLGVSHFLQKPYRIDQLTGLINKVL